MKIDRKKIEELNAAPYNPRKDLTPNDEEYEKLRRSLQEFGYVEPIIWNERTGNVVGGHQRLKVLRQLGETELDCVIVNLSLEHEKALNVALNKISGNWDMEKLTEVLLDLQSTDIDVTLTGFDSEELEKILNTALPDEEAGEDNGDGYYGDEREKTYNFYRLHEYDASRTAGYYQFPTLEACHYVPEDLIGFNYVKSWKGKRAGLGVHFFLDDYQFERIWSNPYENIERLRGFGCVLTPDFSTYLDMPMAMKIWNIYRSRLIGQMMQDAGLNVIPTLQWSEAETLKFCFDGLPEGVVLAVSTVGVMREERSREIWSAGMTAAIERLKPEAIIIYGSRIDYDFGGIEVKEIGARKFS